MGLSDSTSSTTWNSGASRLYGYEADEAIGRHASFLYPAGRKEEIDTVLQQIRTGRPIDRLETKRLRKDGSLIDVSVTFSMLMNTPSSMLEADIWRANYRLRKLGLDPLPFGESRLRDALKARALRAIRGVRDFVSGTEAAANASPWY